MSDVAEYSAQMVERIALAQQTIAAHARSAVRVLLQAAADELAAVLDADSVLIGLFATAESPTGPHALAGSAIPFSHAVNLPARIERARTEMPEGKPTALVLPSGDHTLLYPLGPDNDALGIIEITCTRVGFSTRELSALAILERTIRLALNSAEIRQQLQQKEHDLSILHRSARTISGSLNIQIVLQSLLDGLKDLLQPSFSAVFMLNDPRTHLLPACSDGVPEERREVQLDVQGLMVRQALQFPGVYSLNSEQLQEFHTLLDCEILQSGIVGSLESGGEVLGVLVAARQSETPYSNRQMRLVETLLAQAGTAVHNAFMYEDLSLRKMETETLYRLARDLASTHDSDKNLRAVSKAVEELLLVTQFAVLMYNSQENMLQMRSSSGLAGAAASFKCAPGESIPGWIYQWLTPARITDIEMDVRNASHPLDVLGVRSVMGVPLTTVDNELGVLLAMSPHRRHWAEHELNLLDIIANHLATALENNQLNSQHNEHSRAVQRGFNRIAASLKLSAGVTTETVATIIREMVHADTCVMHAVIAGELLPIAFVNKPDDEISWVTNGDIKSHTAWVARYGRVLAVGAHNTPPHGTLEHTIGPFKSYLGIPIKEGRHTVGVLEVFSHKSGAFSNGEEELLAQFARSSRLAERFVFNQP